MIWEIGKSHIAFKVLHLSYSLVVDSWASLYVPSTVSLMLTLFYLSMKILETWGNIRWGMRVGVFIYYCPN
uniref:Uncharacterized protein n=1 Tax=Urocitellus parryii TaxID=9999 RepID=A0A8D2H4Q6_UROPR